MHDDPHSQQVEVAKRLLRGELRARRRSMAGRAEASERIVEATLQLEQLRAVGCVHVYLSTPVEVDTYQLVSELLRGGRRVVVPVLDAADTMTHHELLLQDLSSFVIGPHGIPQPGVPRHMGLECVDAFVVPLVGFDRTGARLGNGSGHYDRVLAVRRPGTPVIGLAFALQECPAVPQEPHDVPLGVVVTEHGVRYPR